MDKSLNEITIEYSTIFEGNEVKIYEIDEGLEYEIILKEQPISNMVKLPFRFDERLSINYQPPMNLEYKNEKSNSTHGYIDKGELVAYRPLNVVGSYAIYCDKANNEYKAGKIAHLYRAYGYDEKGIGYWLDYKMIDREIYIILPKDVNIKFIDPFLGYDTIGGTKYEGNGYGNYDGHYAVGTAFEVDNETITLTGAHWYGSKQSNVLNDATDLPVTMFSMWCRMPRGKDSYRTDNTLAHEIVNGETNIYDVTGLCSVSSGGGLWESTATWHNLTYSADPILYQHYECNLDLRKNDTLIGYILYYDYIGGQYGLYDMCMHTSSLSGFGGDYDLVHSIYDYDISFYWETGYRIAFSMYVDYTVNPVSSGGGLASGFILALLFTIPMGILIIAMMSNRKRRRW
jgi:hypothetical protein